ncbi:Nitrate reductase [NADH] 1 [Abeliophyllum distichum]|uniref:Nitrate reductase [NADH] 1 n=1 Tax=Abeliophyllum distichum TaxID=126358 RepID=A0ABD1UQJ5_9LAMI
MHNWSMNFSAVDPVTLVCAENCKNEQNMVKQNIGFNWGTARISTFIWRGVLFRAILKRCSIYCQKNGLNVCFEGTEDFPSGGGAKFCTSIKKEIAMDLLRDIILGLMQHGEKGTGSWISDENDNYEIHQWKNGELVLREEVYFLGGGRCLEKKTNF